MKDNDVPEPRQSKSYICHLYIHNEQKQIESFLKGGFQQRIKGTGSNSINPLKRRVATGLKPRWSATKENIFAEWTSFTKRILLCKWRQDTFLASTYQYVYTHLMHILYTIHKMYHLLWDLTFWVYTYWYTWGHKKLSLSG